LIEANVLGAADLGLLEELLDGSLNLSLSFFFKGLLLQILLKFELLLGTLTERIFFLYRDTSQLGLFYLTHFDVT
jgi:hypothetical protein